MLFNPSKLKVQLRLAVNRLKMLQNKKASIIGQQRREIATLLEKGKEESARIRVEHVIQEDYSIEAMEMVEIYCEMLLARFGLIEQMKQLDPSIQEAASSIVYAAPRIEVQELGAIKALLSSKYGKDFASKAADNKDGCVNERLVNKMKVKVPDPKLVTRYLIEIAKNYNVAWNADESELEFDSSLMGDSTLDAEFSLPSPPKGPPSVGKGGGGSSNAGGGGGGGGGGVSVAPSAKGKAASTSTPASAATFSDASMDNMFPSVPTSPPRDHQGYPEPPEDTKDDIPPAEDDGNMPDFDELTKRFEALKRRQ